MSGFPPAYHMTFGTYGTRLHGDERGTVSRDQNRFGDPIIGRDDEWRHDEQTSLRFPTVYFHAEQRFFVEATIPAICQRGGWTLHIAACQRDHVHVLLSAERPGRAVRKWLKRWLGEALSERWQTQEDQTWWAEGGSVKWILDEPYFDAVFRYIERQRTTDEREQTP